jgi:serine/threonine-protein kinase RsbW
MNNMITLTLPGDIMFARLASQTASSIARLLADDHLTETDSCTFAHAFELAITEAFTNSVTHAPENATSAMITVTFHIEQQQLTVIITDANEPFIIETPAPDIECFPVHGFGLMIIRKLMDRVIYRREDDSNILAMSKAL